MKTVILSGPMMTSSGYATHASQIAMWLLSKQNLDVKFHLTPWGQTMWRLNETDRDGLNGEIMRRSNPPTKADVAIHVKLPNEFTTDLGNVNIGISAMVECDRCNPKWVEICNKMNAIVVPSLHAAASLTNSGTVNVPLHVVNEAYNGACVKNDLPTLPDFETPFNFLLFGQLTAADARTDRKNIFNTIKWFCEAFKGNDDVGLVIKTNLGKNTKIDRANTKKLLEDLLRQVRRAGKPKVTLLHGDMSDEEVAALYRHPQIKAMVTLSRGEGWNLPACEAAASGLPIIATNWSAHTEFLNLGKFVKIDYTLQQIPPQRVDNNIFTPTARWAEASEHDFKSKILKFHERPEIPTQWARELQPKIVEKLSLDEIFKSYDAAIGDLLC